MDFYGKLGDLLSEAIESGELEKKQNEQKDNGNITHINNEDKAKAKAFNFSQFNNQTQNQSTINSSNENIKTFNFEQFAKMAQEAAKTEPKVQIYKFTQLVIPQNVLYALNIIGIPTNADFETAKKIYREKLMYYHPDKWINTPYLEQAKINTQNLNNAWEIVEWWFVAR